MCVCVCVLPDGATEQKGVLQDDGEARAQGLQGQLGDVNVVDQDPPCGPRRADPNSTPWAVNREHLL